MKGILDSWGVDPFYLFVVMFIIQIVMIVLYVMLNTKYRRLQKSYVTFMRGKNGKNLEKSIFGKFDELDEIAELVRANEKEVNFGKNENTLSEGRNCQIRCFSRNGRRIEFCTYNAG